MSSEASPADPPDLDLADAPMGPGSLYQALVSSAPDGIVVIDEGGLISVVNDQLCRLFGYRADELVGEPVEILLPGRFRTGHVGLRQGFRAHPATRPMGAGLELVGRRKDGEEFPVDVSLSSLGGPGPSLATAFVRDVTARRRAEQELRQSEEHFRLLVEGVADHAIFMIDASGHVITWNVGAERIKGWRPEGILGRHFSVFYPPDDIAAGIPGRHLEQAAAEGQLHSEGWRIRADGTSFWAEATLTAIHDESGTLRGFAKLTRDRTEARQGQARLEAVSALNRAVLEERSSEDDLLRLAVTRARALVDAAVAWICLPGGDETDSAFIVRAADGDGGASLVGAVLEATSICAAVARSGTPEVVADLAADPRIGRRVPGLGYAVFVPLAAPGGPPGVLAVAVKRDRPPLAESQVEVVQLFAVQAAVAVGYRRARRQVEELLLVADRERIARDLHDTVIQRLFAVGLTLEAAARLPRADVGDRIRRAVTDIDDTIRSIRTLIFGLEVHAQHTPGLRRQVLDLTNEMAPALGLEPSVRFTGPIDTLADGQVAQHLIAVLREALSNIARHAAAHHVDVTVEAGDDITLTVDDDGGGQRSAPVGTGRGLNNMAERAKQLGGTFTLDRRDPAGSRLRWRVPRQQATPGGRDLRPWAASRGLEPR